MKLTVSKVIKMDACRDALEWGKTIWAGKSEDSVVVLKRLLSEKKYDWANWLIVRVMKRKRYLAYAIFAAEQAIGIYEAQYPDDKQPRQSIEAAKRVLKNDNKENRAAARAAARAAWAAWDARAASAAARAAAWVARAAARDAGDAAKEEMQLRILNYGMGLLMGK